jgi:hypothetical protein
MTVMAIRGAGSAYSIAAARIPIGAVRRTRFAGGLVTLIP